MDSDSLPTILLLILLTMMSAYFSSSETAFTSVNHIRLRTEAKKGDQRAERALRLAEDFSNLLSTILVGNNIVNIAASAIATILFLSAFPTYGATISTIVMTVTVLIFGEITPKALAKQNPEKIAKLFAPSLLFLMKLLKPINWIFAKWNAYLAERLQPEEAGGVTEEELLSIVSEAESGGNIEDYEHELIRSAIAFNDITVKSILTPRMDVVAAEQDASVEEVQCLFETHEYSRILLYDDTIDNVIGMLHERDFNRYRRQKEQGNTDLTLADMSKEALFVPPMYRLSRLLKSMQQKRIHMAVITDEYGGTMGIVTMEDILEELVGDIWDETDEVEEELIHLPDGKYVAKGHVALEKIFQLFDMEGAESYTSNTISGFLTEWTGHFPQEGDSLTFQGLDMDVVKVNGTRIEEVHIQNSLSKKPVSFG